MKMLALSLLTFLTASLTSPSVMGDPSPAAPGPRPGTVEAMRCLVGQGSKGCDRMFVGAAGWTARELVFASAERTFQRGPLVSSTYLGQASDTNPFDVRALRGKFIRETAILDVKFAHQECTFYISPPDADGKIRTLVTMLHAPHDLAQLRDRGACL
jgi:hypothetical protein